MSKEVVIKSNRYGINLILDSRIPFQELLASIGKRFRETGDFFKDSRMAISFKGRELTAEEEQEIIDVIMQNSSVRIVSIIDDDDAMEARMKERVEAVIQREQAAAEALVKEALSGEGTAPGKADSPEETPADAPQEQVTDFYKGCLRSGQILESSSSITLVGDVNPGAKIVSEGNIVVLGSLKGNACAGAGGDRGCFIYALEMRPLQLQIGDIIAKSPDKEKGPKRGRKKEKDAKNSASSYLATTKDDNILLEPVTRNILNKLS